MSGSADPVDIAVRKLASMSDAPNHYLSRQSVRVSLLARVAQLAAEFDFEVAAATSLAQMGRLDVVDSHMAQTVGAAAREIGQR